MTLTVGSIVNGVVTGITKFGAFVRLEDNAVGLVHISEVADSYVKDIADFLKEGQEIRVKVMSVAEGGKIGLSIKQAQAPAPPAPRQERYTKPDNNFEDKLADFMKDSNERLTILKKHQDGRRGSRK